MMIHTAAQANSMKELEKNLTETIEAFSKPVSWEQKEKYEQKVISYFLEFISKLKESSSVEKSLLESFVCTFFEKILEIEIDQQIKYIENEEKVQKEIEKNNDGPGYVTIAENIKNLKIGMSYLKDSKKKL
ncbi:hypothetical protein HE1_01092 [Holospora elegans E1]|uniref:Uncharacterized protein n=2 Tax=Holospora TaxID=44747 RepID=A0A023E008_9PROT|nr:hypothetical protein HE1_01092 [Holospora elegans E1]